MLANKYRGRFSEYYAFGNVIWRFLSVSLRIEMVEFHARWDWRKPV